MFVIKSEQWNQKVRALEKFAIERIVQRCDFSEIISNKHRTINGYTQLKELIRYCDLTLKRRKTIKTLITIVKEAKSDIILQNIKSDIIIKKYFTDVLCYFEDFDEAKFLAEKGQPNLIVLENFLQQLKIFECQLDDYYYLSILREFSLIDYSEEKQFKRNADQISKLIDILIPFLLFRGYSLATIVETIRFWIRNEYHVTIKKIVDYFTFGNRSFTFLQCLGTKSEDMVDFLDVLNSEVNVEVEEIVAQDLGVISIDGKEITKDFVFAKYTIEVLDPYTHIRSNFDNLLKRVVQQKERQSLIVFNSFFDFAFYTKKRKNVYNKYKRVLLEGDSININARAKTLRRTVYLNNSCEKYNEKVISDYKLSYGDCKPLQNAIYYYNLGLASKSIENSLSLLWTALEAIQPYKIYSSDIESVQNFVSKAISLGAISRRLYGFGLRLIQTNQQNNGCFDDLGTIDFKRLESKDGLLQWYTWLADEETCKEKFKKLKSYSELLAYEFHNIAFNLINNKQSFLLDRITASEFAIKFQLQRIYSHRNKIVHSGDMINEYSNLWSHLEWYVGKMLAYFVTELFYKKRFDSLYDAFVEIDSDHSYLVSYLEKNKENKIADLPHRITNLLFKHSWLAY